MESNDIKDMTQIPGYIHAFVGIVMVIFSYYIEQTGEANLIFFYIIGIGFIIYGVFKTLKSYILNDKNDELDKDFNKKKEYKNNIIQCPRCMTKHYTKSNYCHMCGKKLPK